MASGGLVATNTREAHIAQLAGGRRSPPRGGVRGVAPRPSRRLDIGLMPPLDGGPGDGRLFFSPEFQRDQLGMGIRVLVAEDNVTNREVARGILRKLGIFADVVANGREAIDILRRVTFDLVFMDVEMPEMDGLDATRALRASGSERLNASIPVIAMTARALCGDREVCLAAGMDDYIAKPVTPASLARLIEKWVGKPGSGPNKSEKTTPTASAGQTGNGRTPAVFNHSDLLARLMGDGFLARIVVLGFRAEIARQLDALQGCLDVRDLKGAEHQVRTIKAAANDIGAERLVGLPSSWSGHGGPATRRRCGPVFRSC